jgi:hypothetical protein
MGMVPCVYWCVYVCIHIYVCIYAHILTCCMYVCMCCCTYFSIQSSMDDLSIHARAHINIRISQAYLSVHAITNTYIYIYLHTHNFVPCSSLWVVSINDMSVHAITNTYIHAYIETDLPCSSLRVVFYLCSVCACNYKYIHTYKIVPCSSLRVVSI